MAFLDIYLSDGKTLVQAKVSLEHAATVVELDETDIEWAIEEEGRCDGEKFIIVPTGEPAPGPYKF